MRGAIREDDVPCGIGPNPCDDPVNGPRPLSHFFDPVLNRPLTVGISLGDKATDWITGTTNAYANPAQEDASRLNHFSLVDANEAMYRALTGRSTTGAIDIGPGNGVATDAVRKAYWATTFRSLGDVLHIVQDMAQPQHTRNDAHLVDGNLNKQAYEAYTNNRALGQGLTCFNGQSAQSQGISYAGYPEVRFDRFRSFLSSTPGSQAGVNSGTGIADYSNRGFFTAGSNFGNTTYAKPPAANIESDYRADLSAIDDGCLSDDINFVSSVIYRRAVTDTFNSTYTAQDVALTADGIWTRKFLGLVGYEKQGYGLGRVNYDEMADLLIPRAVAYGAGVIDYFFRGRIKVMDIREEVSTGGTPGYRVTVKNVSGYPVATATDFSEGMFSFYYKALDQNNNSIMRPVSVLEGDNPQLANGATLAPDATLDFLLAKPGNDWDHAKPPSMVAIFHGQIGLEPGVAAYVFSPGGLVTIKHIQDAANRAVFTTYLSENKGNHWASAYADDPDDGGGNHYVLSDAEYTGGTSITAFGYSTPVGSTNRYSRVYRSADLGRTWEIQPYTNPGVNITYNGILRFYDFQHRAYVGDNTMVTLGIPSGASQPPGNDFYSDFVLYESADLGASWTATGSLSGVYYPGKIVYTGKAVTGLRTYALLAAYDHPGTGTLVGFFRSYDGGQSWVRENDNVFITSVAHDSFSFEGVRGEYNLVYMGGNTFLANYVSYLSVGPGGGAEYSNDFYLSTNGGDLWTSISAVPEPDDDGDPLTIGEVKELHYLGGNTLFAYIYHDKHANGYPYFGGYLSTDGGYNWVLFNPGLPLNLDTSNAWSYHTDNYDPFVGAIDNGAVPGLYDVP